MSHDRYQTPLVTRYASAEMAALWSNRRRVLTWRDLWLALAETQKELGLPITNEQIEQLRDTRDEIDWERVAEYERELRHDVMAHVRAWAERCPQAKAIIHLGATSCFVTDNADLILIREALTLLRDRLVQVIQALAEFARRYRKQPCLGFTHLQPAQPTTLGKRATLWCYDFIQDWQEVDRRLRTLKFRGAKGTTGTQASFLALFDGDHDKVVALDERLAQRMGFSETYPVTGQTYPRKVDAQILAALAGIGQSAHRFGTDVRILQSRRELEEPFGETQVGSSAMAYKRNPMRSERMCALGRFLMSLVANTEQTAATQWLERTLDDSANRRIVLPQAFLAADALLILARNVAAGLVAYPKVLERHLQQELPFLATETILMAAVRAGGDRQELHERIRRHSMEAARRVKELGEPNDLLERLRRDPAFKDLDFDRLLDPTAFIGRAPQQVDAFLESCVEPILRAHEPSRSGDDDLRV